MSRGIWVEIRDFLKSRLEFLALIHDLRRFFEGVRGFIPAGLSFEKLSFKVFYFAVPRYFSFIFLPWRQTA